jgi:hypothetical protein
VGARIDPQNDSKLGKRKNGKEKEREGKKSLK